MSLLKEGLYGRIKRIEGLAKPQCMELLPPFLEGLGQRRSNAASFVAQKAQQATQDFRGPLPAFKKLKASRLVV